MERRNWTRKELILAFNLYCKLPFGSLHSRNAKVIELAKLIGRSSNAVALKLSNFASFDPHLQSRGIKGMANASKMDKAIWDEFHNNWEGLIFESEKVLAEISGKDLKEIVSKPTIKSDLIGEDRYGNVKIRVNQNFFRQVILTIYSYQCAICSLNIPDLLIAGHIVPWSANNKERLNPQNGICFCALHDKAFDKGLIGIDSDFKVIMSQELEKVKNNSFFFPYFGNYEHKCINLPDKFLPRTDFLQFHLKEIFRS